MTVSAALLVLDPPVDRLATLLEAIRPVTSDVVIVVDDRTRPETVEVMSTWRDVTLTTFRWVDDFAAARNQALNLCRGDWVLHVDPDEMPSLGMLEFIRSVDTYPDREWGGWTYRAAQGYLFWTVTYVAGRPVEGNEPDWHCRLFRRSPRNCWYKRVHEQVMLDGRPESETRESAVLPKAPVGAYLIHSKEDTAAKLGLYTALEATA